MKIIETRALENGAHRNQEFYGSFVPQVPNGWAVIPEDMPIPDTFPFVDIEVENGVVTAMERVEAQVAYTAMMTDTLIEEV